VLSFPEPDIQRLRHEYPFFRMMAMRVGAIDGGEPRTIGVYNLLICRSDLEESLVHDVTQIFFDALPRLSSQHQGLRSMELEQAPATPIPLHEGAGRYYRERELFP
jgi:TRAP-type uncharacterized transport system substrate-binding protein